MKNIGMEKPAPAPKQMRKKVAAEEDDRSSANTLGDLIKEKLGGKLDLK
jgi:small subunit ribosomal protein S1